MKPIKRALPLAAIAISLGIAASALADVRYVVKGNPNASEPYDSLATAAADIQVAVDFATPGDEVVISNGVFEYETPFRNQQLLTNFVNVAKAITVRGLTGRPEDVILRLTKYNYYNSLRLANLSAGAVLAGVTIEGGYVNANAGAGVSVSDNSMISNCVIRNCKSLATWGLAAVYASGTEALVTHCVISNNVHEGNNGDNAAGVYLSLGPRCENSLIADNQATGSDADVGGVFVYGASSLRNCTLVNNSGRGYGAVKVKQITGVVSNCVMAANSAAVGGAGYADRDPDRLNRFWNCATSDGSKINDTCVFDDVGNLLANYQARDFSPASGSRLVNNGAFWPDAPLVDLAGKARVQGEGIDIGCYEYDESSFSPSIRTSGDTTAICPFTVGFGVSVPESIQGHLFEYAWDLDGDGKIDSTEAEPRFSYLIPGNYDVRVHVKDLTASAEATSERKGLICAVPPRLLVSSGNDNAAFPYDSETNAAADILTAIGVAIDGCEIEVLSGDYPVSERIVVNKNLRLHGRTGIPGDVRVFATRTGVGLLSVDNSAAIVSAMSFSGADVQTTAGHALSLSGAGGTVSNCVFRNCKTSGNAYDGAAVQLNGAKSLITHCVISNCVDLGMNQDGCGGLELQNKSRAENCLVVGNSYDGSSTAVTPCGGVYVRDGSLVNCTIVSNSSTRSVGGIRTRANQVCTIANCAIACNVGTGYANADPEWYGRFFNCGTDDAQAFNSTCVRGAPAELFCDPFDGDFRVKASSPLFGVGDNAFVRSSADLDGNPRIVGRKVDVGCFESQVLRGLLLLVK